MVQTSKSQREVPPDAHHSECVAYGTPSDTLLKIKAVWLMLAAWPSICEQRMTPQRA